MLRMFFTALLFVIGCVANSYTHADERVGEVDIAMVLLVDASGSVSPQRWRAQLLGYAAAFRSPEVLSAIRRTARGAIATTLVQWSGPSQQRQSVRWHRIDTADTADYFAGLVSEVQQGFGDSTCISSALSYGQALLKEKRFDAYRGILNFSGDGPNNYCTPPTAARDAAVRAGTTINGIAIVAGNPLVVDHYRDEVIGGPGSFLMVAQGYQDFPIAVRRKLVLEIAQR